MKLNIKNTFVLITAVFLFAQCSQSDEHGHEEHEEHAQHQEKHEDTHGEHEEAGKNIVELNKVQLAAAELEYGHWDTLNISGFVKANGVLDLPPQNIATISAPLDGFVRKANHLVGQKVEKGEVLAVLEHLDYIKLQERYIELLSKLQYLKSEFERLRELAASEVASKKEFEAAQGAYQGAMARKVSLEKQLQYMGLSAERVAKGNISGTITVRAPFSGYITKLNVHNGQFAQSDQELYELIDPEHMHLELNVFEQDIDQVKIGQQIRFTIPSRGNKAYKGEVFLVGKSFETESKTVKIHGHIEKGERDEFIRGLYTEAKIYTANQEVIALPQEAIIRDEGKSFIFIRNEEPQQQQLHASLETEAEEHHHEQEHGASFRKVQIATGKKDQGFLEIKQIAENLTEARIVTKGAYFLHAEMKKGEGGHHH